MKKMYHVLEVEKNKIKLSVVKISGKNSVEVVAEESFSKKSDDSIEKAIIKLFEHADTNSKKIRILLDDTYAYVLSMRIPNTIEQNNYRAYIFEEIKKLIPEHLMDNEWDFKIHTHSKTKKDPSQEISATVFAPVSSVFRSILSTLADLEIIVEAVEPTSISRLRDDNPNIGLALKTDIIGNDSTNLNISSGPHSLSQLSAKSFFSKTPFYALFFILGTLSIAVITYVIGSTQFISIPRQMHTNTDQQTDVLSPIIEDDIPETLSFAPNEYSLQIVNTSGVQNVENEIKLFLQQRGFASIDTIASESASNVGVSISYKENISSELLSYIDATLQNYFAQNQNREYAVDSTIDSINSSLSTDSKFDLLIIVGK